MRLKTLLVPLLSILLFFGCDSADPDDPTPPGQVTAGVIVASQGAFGADDGGVILYRVDGTVAARHEGLYVQSATPRDGAVYVTSSDRVDVLSAPAFALEGQLGNIPNPRYVAFSETHGFVTSLYTDPNTFGDGAVTRFDPATLTVEQTAVIGGNPEGIAYANGRLFVAGYDFAAGTTVAMLDPQTLQVLDRVEVGCDGPRMLFVDRQLEVQVVCEGNPWSEPATPGAIVTLESTGGSVVDYTELPTTLGTSSLGQVAAYVPGAVELYAISDEHRRVYRFDTNANALTAALDVGGAPLNGVDYDPRRDYLYLARMNPTDPFAAQGTVTVHTRDGALVDTFQGAGVAPTHVQVLALDQE